MGSCGEVFATAPFSFGITIFATQQQRLLLKYH